MAFDDETRVTPDGLAIRRMRRERGWSRRACVEAIAEARVRETGLRETITPHLLEHIEESNEPVPYDTVCRIAAGLDCNPMDLVS
jgi:hypothetical protein